MTIQNVKLYKNNTYPRSVTHALRAGGVGVIPTDTIYGVVGSALSKETVERIYKIKGRKSEKPFIILIASISDLKLFNVEISRDQKEWLKSVWPGLVSVVLPCKSKNFQYLHRGTNSLAFRLPKDQKLRDFLEETRPLVAPSANPEGLGPACDIKNAEEYFGSGVDFYIDGGEMKSEPSALIDLTKDKPKILRGFATLPPLN